MRERFVLLASLLSISTLASAEPLKAINAEEVRVALSPRPQRALGVKATAAKDGWRLQLKVPVDGVAEVFDVTPGTPAITFTLRMVAGLVNFDIARFAGGHTYHVAVKTIGTSSSGLVYLYPEAPLKQQARRGATRVKFEEHEATAPTDDIAIEKKGSL